MKLLFRVILLSFVMNVFAAEEAPEIREDEVIDPSDAAKPMSMLSIGVTQFAKDNAGGPGGTGINAMGAVAGMMSKESRYVVLLEARAKPDLTLDYYRGRWFNVFQTGDDVVSNVGYSIDYFGNDAMNSLSVGTLLQFETGLPFMRLFWNAAYNYSKQNINVGGTTQREEVNGVYTNLFLNFILSQNMTYLMLIPEYQFNKSSTVDSNGYRMTASIGAPLIDSKTLWLATSFIYQKGKLNYDLGNIPGAGNPYGNVENINTYVNFNLTYYFR